MVATASDIGILYQMPFEPKNNGKINRHGMSTNTCRLNDRMIAFLAIPMLWKKLDVTIWNPTNGNISIVTRNPCAERAINVSSVVNAETASRGMSCDIRNPVVVMMVAIITVIFMT